MSQFEKGNKSGFDRENCDYDSVEYIKKILERNEERLPLLTLDDFFNGNTAEDSIAPNQWGFGRPTLSEIWNMLQKIELLPNIAWVRVALHDDTEIVENDGTEELVLAGDTIVICTTISPAELEKNCEL